MALGFVLIDRNILKKSAVIKIAFDPIYAHPLPANHRFPMLKYELIPAQLLHEGTCIETQFFTPEKCSEHIVTLTHDRSYYNKLIHQQLSAFEQRVIGFPQSTTLIDRELTITQGTIDACNFAFYLSGVDILDTDKLGKLKVSIDDCKQRDRIVFNQLKKHKIPVVVALGGGYSPEIKTIVEAHCNTFRLAMDLYS